MTIKDKILSNYAYMEKLAVACEVCTCYSIFLVTHRSQQEVARILGIAAVVSLGAGCEQHDIGRECPLLEVSPPSTGGTRVETNEVVAQDYRFDCEELICVATDGRAGYCSKKCRENAGCPDGFECRQVQSIGDFSGEMFCVWKTCDRPKDCGSKDEFRCCHPNIPDLCGGEAEGLTLASDEDIKLCTFRE